MSHQINVSDIAGPDSLKTIDLAGSYGNGENKSIKLQIVISNNGEVSSIFVVLNQKKEVLNTSDINQAVEKYNSL